MIKIRKWSIIHIFLIAMTFMSILLVLNQNIAGWGIVLNISGVVWISFMTYFVQHKIRITGGKEDMEFGD